MDIRYTILIVFLGNFILGLFIYQKNKTKLVNIFSALVAFVVAFWALSMFFYIKPIFFNSEIWIKIVYFFVMMMPISWGYFFKVFLDLKKAIIPHLIFFISIILIAILFFTDWWVVKVVEKSWGPETIVGPAYFAVGFFIILCIIWASFHWIRAYRIARGIKKMQLFYVFLGMFIFSILVTIFDVIIPIATGNSQFFWISPFFASFFVGANVYAITRYRLMDLRFIASKVYSNLFIASFFFLYFYALYILMNFYFSGVNFLFFSFFLLIFSFLFVLILFPVLEYIQKSSDAIFFKGFNFRKIISNLLVELSQFNELNKIYEILNKEIQKFLSVENVSFLIISPIQNSPVLKISKNKSFGYFSLVNKKNIINKLQTEQNILIYDELKDENIKKEMLQLKLKIILPIVVGEDIVGLIALGEKENGGGYSSGDISLLEMISNQSSVSIYNALLYEELKSLRKNLTSKIDQQTKNLQKKAEYLTRLLEKRTEFLDIAAHQLRTPTTVIKGFLSMIVDGAIQTSKQKEEFLKVCLKKSIKLTEIINDILRASELDTEEFKLDLKPVDVNIILEKVYNTKKIQQQRNKDISFDLKLPSKKLPKIMSDERYLEQILNNLLNNAIQYTLSGFVNIKASTSKDKKKVIIKIIDSGMGIPKKEQEKVFEKFYRAENIVEIFTDGSGLGLFVVKKAIDLHPGAKVYIEKSVVNKGSTFVLEFPAIK